MWGKTQKERKAHLNPRLLQVVHQARHVDVRRDLVRERLVPDAKPARRPYGLRVARLDDVRHPKPLALHALRHRQPRRAAADHALRDRGGLARADGIAMPAEVLRRHAHDGRELAFRVLHVVPKFVPEALHAQRAAPGDADVEDEVVVARRRRDAIFRRVRGEVRRARVQARDDVEHVLVHDRDFERGDVDRLRVVGDLWGGGMGGGF